MTLSTLLCRRIDAFAIDCSIVISSELKESLNQYLSNSFSALKIDQKAEKLKAVLSEVIKAIESAPLYCREVFAKTASNQPILLGLPVVVPYSLPFFCITSELSRLRITQERFAPDVMRNSAPTICSRRLRRE